MLESELSQPKPIRYKDQVKCAVTGAAGFIGGHLVGHLRSLGHEVIGLGSEHPQAQHAFEMDLTNESAVHACIERVQPDQVYHLAGAARVSGQNDFDNYFRMNFLTTRVVSEALARTGKDCRILLASSVHVYGSAEGTVDEHSELRPESDYGFTKYLAEQQIKKVATESSGRVRGLVARLGNCVGPGQAAGFVVSDFCIKVSEVALGKRDSLQVGTLKAERQFMDVRDLVSLFPTLLEKGATQPFTVFNVASPELVTIERILKLLLEISKTAPPIQEDPAFAANKLQVLKVDTAKLEKVCASRYLRPLEETLRDAYEATYQRLSGNH